MSRVLIVGAHGKVAMLAAPRLIARGHQVFGVIRNPDQADEVQSTGAAPVVADVEHLSTDELTEVVRGCDVVVWSAGAGGGSPERTYAVDRDAAARTIDAASAAGVPRFVLVSYYGAGLDHGVDPDDPFYAYAEAKAEADAHLAASDLAWTLLRPSGLTDEPATGIDPATGKGGHISRAAVAEVIAAVVDHPDTTVRRTLDLNDGDQSVDDVVATKEL